jgi:5S rRNA maturation endonuclease (ribonuclease M5)
MDEKQQLWELIDELRQKQILVLVEGLKDKRALENLGITNVLTLKKPLYAVVEEVASKTKEVVLLTDLDEEGKKLYHQLARDLQKHKVKINNKLREFLFTTELRQVEGLAHYLESA